MIGLGTQDDLRMAEEFVATYGTSFTMLWDPSFESWIHFGITGQPAGVLASPQGEILGTWRGPLPEDDILTAVADLT